MNFITGITKQTVIFIGKFKNLDSYNLNKMISRDNNNLNLPSQYREIEKVELFEIKTGKQFEGLDCQLSDYAIDCLKIFKKI